MTTEITLHISVILLVIAINNYFYVNRQCNQLREELIDLQVKLSRLDNLIFDIFSKNGQPGTKFECSDLQGNEKPGDATNTNPQKGYDNR